MMPPKTSSERQEHGHPQIRARRYRKKHQTFCCVVSERMAFILAFIEIGIILASFAVAYYIYPDIEEIVNDQERKEWKVFYWCLIASNFLAIAGAIGWAYGVKSDKIAIFFWPWIICNFIEYVLFLSVLAGLFFMHAVKARVLFIPFAIILFLPGLCSIGYYQAYRVVELSSVAQ